MLHLNWDDQKYRAAKIERAAAYAEFCKVASQNPFRHGQDGFQTYYDEYVAPAKATFAAADDKFRTETGRISALALAA